MPNFKAKALAFAAVNFEYVCLLEGNNQPYLYDSFPQLLAFGSKRHISVNPLLQSSFEALRQFQLESSSDIFGVLTYDLKNEVENLKSENQDFIEFPQLLFFEPLYVIYFSEHYIQIIGENQWQIFDNIMQWKPTFSPNKVELNARISRDEYINSVNSIKSHIKRGDIYELNFCQEFYANQANIDPTSLYLSLNEISPMPFASFFKAKSKFLICASPERFLKKEGRKLISQPIKGTVKRGKNLEEDLQLKFDLLHSDKELAENVMIVDLVRNDLSKTAKDGSVKVEELHGIYSFSHVHQMISTVVAELDDRYDAIDAIKNAFPMGSMTGAPKFSAMELIEKFEKSKRGLFSGAVGYIRKNGDFDFNVVIRSILYNEDKKYLSCQVGSAITIDAIAEKEWEECEIKLSAVRKALT